MKLGNVTLEELKSYLSDSSEDCQLIKMIRDLDYILMNNFSMENFKQIDGTGHIFSNYFKSIHISAFNRDKEAVEIQKKALIEFINTIMSRLDEVVEEIMNRKHKDKSAH